MTPPQRSWLRVMSCRLAAAFLAATVAAVTAPSAVAETIYLRNGRVIHTESARIEDGNVVFEQYGGTVSIPLAAVDRVVEDTATEQETRRPMAADPQPSSTPSEAARLGQPADPPPPGPVAAASGQAGNPEFWLEQIVEIDARIERVQRQLDRLPYYSEIDQRLIVSGQIMYFVAERAKWETFMSRLTERRKDLERSARRAGALPADLRAVRRR